MKISDIINEIGDGAMEPYPYTRRRSEALSSLIFYFFKTENGTEYRVEIEKENESDDEEESDWVYYVGFEITGHGYGYTSNEGKVYRVMATVLAIIKDELAQETKYVTKIKMSPTDARRSNVYKKYIENQLPGATVDSKYSSLIVIRDIDKTGLLKRRNKPSRRNPKQ